jgi:protein FRA10AC1
MEDKDKKNALVKVRLCPECGVKLNYKKNKERKELEKLKRKEPEVISDEDIENNINPEKRLHLEIDPDIADQDDNLLNIETAKKMEEELVYQRGLIFFDIESSRNHWTKPVQIDDTPKTKEDEIDDFLADLFQ